MSMYLIKICSLVCSLLTTKVNGYVDGTYNYTRTQFSCQDFRHGEVKILTDNVLEVHATSSNSPLFSPPFGYLYYKMFKVEDCYATITSLMIPQEFFNGTDQSYGMMLIIDANNVETQLGLNQTEGIVAADETIYLQPGDTVYVRAEFVLRISQKSQFLPGINSTFYYRTVNDGMINETTLNCYMPIISDVRIGTHLQPLELWDEIECQPLVNGSHTQGFKVQRKQCVEDQHNTVVNSSYCPWFHLSVQKCNLTLSNWSAVDMGVVSECTTLDKCGRGFRTATALCLHNDSSVYPLCLGHPPVYIEPCYIRCLVKYTNGTLTMHITETPHNSTYTAHTRRVEVDGKYNFSGLSNGTMIINKIYYPASLDLKVLTFFIDGEIHTKFERDEILHNITKRGNMEVFMLNINATTSVLYLAFDIVRLRMQIEIAETSLDKLGEWGAWENGCMDAEGRRGLDTRSKQCMIYKGNKWVERNVNFCVEEATEYNYCSRPSISYVNAGECPEEKHNNCTLQMNTAIPSTRCNTTNSILYPNKHKCFEWFLAEVNCTDSCNNVQEIVNTTRQCQRISSPAPANASLCSMENSTEHYVINNTCKSENCQVWSSCNSTCGEGVKWRGIWENRTCVANNTCTTTTTTTTTTAVLPTTLPPPYVYGEAYWGLWGTWSSCSVTCGMGVMQRTRKCYPSSLGENCTHLDTYDETDQMECVTNVACPGLKLAKVGESCSETCKGHGLHCSSELMEKEIYSLLTATINCSTFQSSPELPAGYSWTTEECYTTGNPGYPCTELPPSQFQLVCNCKIQAELEMGEWSMWGECSEPCDWGNRTRSRQSVLADDVITHKHTQTCKVKECPVDGAWGEWGNWSSCSHTCGEGTRLRMRECNNPHPGYGGLACHGTNNETQHCSQTIICPIHGGWTEWSKPTDCDRPCGNGTRKTVRSCTYPIPEFGGKMCKGKWEKISSCSNPPCRTQVKVDLALEFSEEEFMFQYERVDSEPAEMFRNKIINSMKKMYKQHNISTNFDIIINEIKDGAN